ncbi:hypothetical protein SAMD00019534_004420 [Acytostelium subglobosum LB1]|uniref:hypothetical protein n=1 Tax=Acytostelium subglobosum LB1 TaxID=1410327 RepID=UPI0006451133|nr:hypothetical protein SAMD00019534_004420 [Acytostelium subglobosum LB1]GAM17267.1 hypothetical protein SAMD00019534_004420 [Acytostelium subglobosum LB1]|eukprot:XP_012759329.1 hypothetical protein SAMD00019534_004420 [Acytostelium subglobosum LB1]
MIYPNDVMNEVLRDSYGCTLFKNYLKAIYCSETLQFWLEIEHFKSIAPPVETGISVSAFTSIPLDTSSSSASSPPGSPFMGESAASTPLHQSDKDRKQSRRGKSSNNEHNNNSNTRYLTQEEVKQCAQLIFDKYLENGSELELNIDAISREQVRQRMADDIDSSIFDEVQKVVYESLWMDCFPPFTHTQAYQKYKHETGKCQLPEFLRFKRRAPKNEFELVSIATR